MLSLIKTIIYSNLLVSACVAAYTHLTYKIYQLPEQNSLVIISMVFCFTYLTYNGQRIFRLAKYKKIGERLQWVVKHQKILKISSFIIGFIGAICLLYINLNTWLILIPMGILSMLYVVPIPFIKKGLRNIHYIKVFIIALVWSLIIIGLPFLNSLNSFSVNKEVMFAFVQCFVFVLAITLPFDVRDIEFDKADGLKTIPQFVGINGTKLIAALLLIGSFLLFYFSNISKSTTIGLAVAHLISLLIIMQTNKKRKELFYAGWVESTVIIMWLSVFIADYLSSL